MDRKKFLKNMLRKHLSKIQDDPKVKKMLTPKEAENGLELIIERMVERITKKESELGRELAFRELRELIMETLDEFYPRITYII